VKGEVDTNRQEYRTILYAFSGFLELTTCCLIYVMFIV
jgi:hypothetical protein